MASLLPGTDSHILADPPRLDFLDRQTLRLIRPMTALEAWNAVMARPLPLMALAFRLRDAVSARFGVRPIGGFSGARRQAVKVGERLDFFLVEHAAPQVLVLTERDRHLDVMTCITTSGGELAITSSVITHNRYGRIYMWPVAPAHRLIVRHMLRRMAQG
ncbi:DUF2867 domain-containing protein [Gemmobacter sp.]|uniref:DUF2867 domain-containing protein n=1 Tax=Gemmobacter sp. TaxID=1898957 RepID=UPI002AFE9DEF|nr:DUF2867 domain-containing protein [Gemmobacter sp.]